jgi:Bifunctional DNA primase/polymerase, N-terminal
VTAGLKVTRNGLGAAAYARAGWPVFPVRPSQPDCPAPESCTCKAPLTRHGVDGATTDLAAVERYWYGHPNANVAIATGWPGPVVLDVDIAHGRPGYVSLNQAIRAGLVPAPMATVRTPSGGLHLYYAPTAGQRNGSLPERGLDWRAERGYVLAPPSAVHGKPYVLTSTSAERASIDFGKIRNHFLVTSARPERLPRDSTRDTSRLAGWVTRLQPGNRNSGLWWAAWRAAQAGDQAAIDQIARAALTTGLGQREVDRTITSALHAAAHPRAQAEREAI